MTKPVLIVLGGLPGVGKTAVARRAAVALPAVLVRIDAIEQAYRQHAGAPRDIGAIGYHLAAAVAVSNLHAGLSCVADSVNPIPETRELWRATAHQADADCLEVELVCSDISAHRSRVEVRQPDINGLQLPGWKEVEARRFDPWPEVALTIDTAAMSPDDAARRIMDAARAIAP